MPAAQVPGQPRVRTAMPASFSEAYRSHAAQVGRWARHLGGVECDPEDAVQEVFWVVSRKWSTLRGDGDFMGWLFGITRRIVANQRRRLRWRRLWAGDEQLASIPSPALGPDAELERRRIAVLFHRALDRLPDKQRTVFVLYELEGMATPAIAELTARNLSTVKVQLARARERFIEAYRRLLQRTYQSEGIGLPQLAQEVGNAAASAPRSGRRTSWSD